MAELGDIMVIPVGKHGRLKKQIWSRCIICGGERWSNILYGKPMFDHCNNCKEHPSGIHNYHWRFSLPKGTIELPVVGDVREGTEIGKLRYRFQWHICELCGNGHWTRLISGKVASKFCTGCRFKGDKAPTWKGGRHVVGAGYIQVYITKDDFFWPMALQRKADVVNGRGYVAEHRLVMAKSIGRILNSFEAVHHKNGNKTDNRIENLELTTHKTHISDHNKGYQDGFKKGYLDGRNKHLEVIKEQNEKLLREIKMLEIQIKHSALAAV
jgi:hypothetical protein